MQKMKIERMREAERRRREAVSGTKKILFENLKSHPASTLPSPPSPTQQKKKRKKTIQTFRTVVSVAIPDNCTRLLQLQSVSLADFNLVSNSRVSYACTS